MVTHVAQQCAASAKKAFQLFPLASVPLGMAATARPYVLCVPQNSHVYQPEPGWPWEEYFWSRCFGAAVPSLINLWEAQVLCTPWTAEFLPGPEMSGLQ